VLLAQDEERAPPARLMALASSSWRERRRSTPRLSARKASTVVSSWPGCSKSSTARPCRASARETRPSPRGGCSSSGRPRPGRRRAPRWGIAMVVAIGGQAQTISWSRMLLIFPGWPTGAP
jgi:hypothetical protein